jgi:ribonuclease D
MISTQADFHALLGRLRGQPEIAIDCEFHGEGRYYPQLCLVQLSSGGEVVAIDPFKIDLTPLGEVLADASVVKVFHAAENDLPLLADATGQPVRSVFDTQLAAAFVGHGASPAMRCWLRDSVVSRYQRDHDLRIGVSGRSPRSRSPMP